MFVCVCVLELTGTWPFIMTSSAKRTLTGLDLSMAFLAALMNADLGDYEATVQEERPRDRGRQMEGERYTHAPRERGETQFNHQL